MNGSIKSNTTRYYTESDSSEQDLKEKKLINENKKKHTRKSGVNP